MNRITNSECTDKRLLSIAEACQYIGQGRTRGTAWLNTTGARRQYGGRVLYDRHVIDAVLDAEQSVKA